ERVLQAPLVERAGLSAIGRGPVPDSARRLLSATPHERAHLWRSGCGSGGEEGVEPLAALGGVAALLPEAPQVGGKAEGDLQIVRIPQLVERQTQVVVIVP